MRRPELRRIGMAFAVAPFTPALLTVPFILLSSGSTQALPWIALVSAVSYAHALVLGLPLFVLLKRFRLLGFLSTVSAGFLIGFAPAAALYFLAPRDGVSASAGNVPTIVNGKLTDAGIMGGLELAFWAGCFGLLVAFTFWPIAYGNKAEP